MSILPTARTGAIATVSALAAAGALAMLTPAAAAPARAPIGAMQAPDGKLQLVQHRRHGWRHSGRWGGRHYGGHRWRGYRGWRHGGWRGNRRYYGYGPGIAAGVAAIIGGSIAASQRDYRDAWQRCDDRYNSFRWSDGTFQPYGDEPRKLCPYLRN